MLNNNIKEGYHTCLDDEYVKHGMTNPKQNLMYAKSLVRGGGGGTARV